jgi:hypothetical protein
VVGERNAPFWRELPQKALTDVVDIAKPGQLIEVELVDGGLLKVRSGRPLVRVVPNRAEQSQIVIIETLGRIGPGRRGGAGTHDSHRWVTEEVREAVR